MSNPERFYDSLYEAKREDDYRLTVQRDWFHRLILDPLFDPAASPRHEVALRLLRGGESLLDVGCSDGAFLESIREVGLYRGLYGVDITSQGIETARERGLDAQVVDLNSESLPYPDEYFDGVTILAVLEHVFDPYAVIREMHRVLRPGGELILAVPNAASLTNRIRILLGRIPVTSTDAGWDGGHLHYFTKHALDRFLTDEGFEILVRKTSGGRPKMRERWISLLAGELIYHCLRQ